MCTLILQKKEYPNSAKKNVHPNDFAVEVANVVDKKNWGLLFYREKKYAP